MNITYKFNFFIFTLLFPHFFEKKPEKYKDEIFKDLFKSLEEMEERADKLIQFQLEETLLLDYTEKAYTLIKNEPDDKLKIKLIEELQSVMADFKKIDSFNQSKK